MKIGVKVKVRSSMRNVVKNSDGTYTAFLMSLPVKGRANEELIELLSHEFGVAKSLVKIIKGLHSKNKIVEIGR